MLPEYMELFQTKTTIPAVNYFNSHYSMSPELMVWLFVYFGSFFVALGLSNFVYKYITENRFARREHVQRVFIVRSNPEYGLEEEILDYVKVSASKPFRIISTNNDYKSHCLSYRKFMKRLLNTNEEIYIVGYNENSWEYENYIYLCKQLNVPVNIIEFSREGVESKNPIPLDIRTTEQIVL